MQTHLTSDTIARRLQEWERFFLTGEESHMADAADLNAFEGDYCPDMLMAAALDTPDPYLRALAARCGALVDRWMARDGRLVDEAHAASVDDLHAALAGGPHGAKCRTGNVYDLWTGQRVQ